MGWSGIPSADIFFDNVEVPMGNIIVEANGGFQKLMEAFDLERCGNATMCLGQASGALEKALKYVQEREQFGKPIVEFQAVQMKLAEMAMKVEGSRLLIHRAAHNAQEGFPSIFESSVGKCFSNETAREVVASAMQLMGGLDSNNISDALKLLSPDCVDVSSGVEEHAGKKNFRKVSAFVDEVRSI